MRNLQLLIFTHKPKLHYSSKLSYTPFILPSLFLHRKTTFVYRLTRGSSILHVHQTTKVFSYQPVVLFSSYQGYLHKFYTSTYVNQNSRPDRITVQLQSILKNPSITKKLYPLYKHFWQNILLEEQHYYRSRPTQSLGLLAPLLSHRQTFGILTKFYLGKMDKEEIMRYAALYPSPFYTWRILQGLSSPPTFIHPFKQFLSTSHQQNKTSMQYVYVKKNETQNNTESMQVIENELPTLSKPSLQQNINTHKTKTNMQSSSISMQDMKQIITQVSKELEKQYRYEAKRYGRGY